MIRRRRNTDDKYIFVLDTNVLLFDSNALNVFAEHDVVIPITVIEEIDHFKKDLNETGRNARMVSRQIDNLRYEGDLRQGVSLSEDTDAKLWVDIPDGSISMPSGFSKKSNDNLILQSALSVEKKNPGRVVLVSRDTNMRIKADALGIPAEDYEHAQVDVQDSYTGIRNFDVDAAAIGKVYTDGQIENPFVDTYFDIYPNQFLVLQNLENPSSTALVKVSGNQKTLDLVQRYNEGIWGIQGRNKEQLFALNLLMDPNIHFVTLTGRAGTGKTLMAIATGLHMAANLNQDLNQYRRLVVSRPIFPLGRDLGFLPGDVSEKLNPWMKPIFDNLEFLLGSEDDHKRSPRYQTLLDQKIIEVEPLTYIRGRSIPRQFFIVDEAQNLTPHEIKTVISRAGEGTKIVMTGDPYQIDNPYVDIQSNGLSYVIERFKRSPLAGHVTLRKGERSALSDLAANVL